MSVFHNLPSPGRWTVSRRLAAGFGTMALLVLAVCVMGYLNIAHTQKLVSEDLASSRRRLASANQMVQLVLEQDMRLRQVGLLTNVSEMQAQATAARVAGAALTATLDQLEQEPRTDAEKMMLDQARALDQRSGPVVDKAVNMALALQSQDAANILTSLPLGGIAVASCRGRCRESGRG